MLVSRKNSLNPLQNKTVITFPYILEDSEQQYVTNPVNLLGTQNIPESKLKFGFTSKFHEITNVGDNNL